MTEGKLQPYSELGDNVDTDANGRRKMAELIGRDAEQKSVELRMVANMDLRYSSHLA